MSEIDSTLNSYAVQSSPVSSTGALNGATSICFKSDTDRGEIAKYKNDNGNLTFEITEQGSAYNWEMQETSKGYLRVIARDPETNKKVFDSLDERRKESSEYSDLANLRPSELSNFTLNGSDGDDKIKISNLNINQVNLKKGKDSFTSDQSLDKFTGTVTADGIDKDDHFSFGKKDSLFQSMTKKIPKSDGAKKTPPAFKITDSSKNAFGTNDENITLIADNGQKTQINVFQRHGAPTYEQSTHGNTIELSQAQITGDNSAEAEYIKDADGNIVNSSKALDSSLRTQRLAEEVYTENYLDKNEAIIQKNIDLQAELAEYDEDSSFDEATAQTTLGNHIKQGRPIEDIQNANQVIGSQIEELKINKLAEEHTQRIIRDIDRDSVTHEEEQQQKIRAAVLEALKSPGTQVSYGFPDTTDDEKTEDPSRKAAQTDVVTTETINSSPASETTLATAPSLAAESSNTQSSEKSKIEDANTVSLAEAFYTGEATVDDRTDAEKLNDFIRWRTFESEI